MRAALAVLVLLVSLPASAGEFVTGVATVIDGDTIRIGDTRIRLHGIDAPEMSDLPAGVKARDALEKLAHRKKVTCYVVDRDRYGRSVARCSVPGDGMHSQRTLGEEMVKSGWAVHARKYTAAPEFLPWALRYDEAEKEARLLRVGVWKTQ